VDVVGHDHIIENGKAVTLLGLEKPVPVDERRIICNYWNDWNGA